MKKLMIAAAVAAMTVGVASAACEETCNACTFAYKLVMNGKSTKAVALEEAPACEEATTACWRQIASIRWVGWVWGQSGDDTCECNALGEFTFNLWNAKTGKIIPDAELTLDFINVLRRSGAKDKAEVCFTFGNVKLAGFGPVTSDMFFKGAHGFFAGSVAAPKCPDCEDELDAQYYTLCEGEAAADNETVAYGRWSLKYSSIKSALLVKNLSANALIPGNWEAVEE